MFTLLESWAQKLCHFRLGSSSQPSFSRQGRVQRPSGVHRGLSIGARSVVLSLVIILLSLGGWWGSSLRKMQVLQETERLRQRKAMVEAVQKLTLSNEARLRSLSLTEKDLGRLVPNLQGSIEQTWDLLESTYGLKNLRIQRQGEASFRHPTQILTVSFQATAQELLIRVLASFLQSYASLGSLKSLKIQQKPKRKTGPYNRTKACQALEYEVYLQVLLFQPRGMRETPCHFTKNGHK